MRLNRFTRTWLLSSVVLAAILVALVAVPIAQRAPQPAQQTPAISAAQLLQTAINKQTVDGRPDEAIAIYQRIVSTFPRERTIVATALVRMAQCHEQLGNKNAQALYERVLRDYSDQPDAAALAKMRLDQIGRAAGAAGATGPVIRQIWPETPGIDLTRISPDGRSVAGVDNETGDLVVVELATRTTRRLTSVPKDRRWKDFAEGPVWSRDGRSLAYAWYTSPATLPLAVELRTVGTQGGPLRTIPIKPPDRFEWPLDWTPDGKAIVGMIRKTGEPRQVLGLISVDDGALTELATGTNSLFMTAAVSSNQQFVAYTRSGALGTTELSLVPVRGGPRLLLREETSDFEVVGWTEDNSGLILLNGKYGSEHLWLQRIANGQADGDLVLLKDVPGMHPTGLSRNGTLLYAVRAFGRSDVFVAPYDGESAMVRGEGRRVSDTTSTRHTSPAWSPDSRQLAWITRTQHRPTGTGMPQTSLSVASLDKNTRRALSLSVSLDEYRNLTWTLDAKSVLARSKDAQRRDGLERINLATGDVEQILSPQALQGTAERGRPAPRLGGWSRDGRTVFKMLSTSLIGGRPRLTSIVQIAIADGTERQVWSDERGMEGIYSAMVLSPDGRWFATDAMRLDSAEGGVWSRELVLFPTSGGAPREIPVADIQFYSWTPNSQGLVYTTSGGTGKVAEAFYYPLDGGAPRSIGLKNASQPAVSPDGKQVAYTIGTPGRDEGVWTMDNFLPAPKKMPGVAATSKK